MKYPAMTREYDAWTDTTFGWWLSDMMMVDWAVTKDRRLDLLNALELSEWAMFNILVAPGNQN